MHKHFFANWFLRLGLGLGLGLFYQDTHALPVTRQIRCEHVVTNLLRTTDEQKTKTKPNVTLLYFRRRHRKFILRTRIYELLTVTGYFFGEEESFQEKT